VQYRVRIARQLSDGPDNRCQAASIRNARRRLAARAGRSSEAIGTRGNCGIRHLVVRFERHGIAGHRKVTVSSRHRNLPPIACAPLPAGGRMTIIDTHGAQRETFVDQAEHRKPSLSVGLARSMADVIAAQRLRYRVFTDELQAGIGHPATGLDIDSFDAHCDHLVVREELTGRVVGTCRILPPHRAREIGRLCSEQEFDMTRLVHLKPDLIEVGRSCVHPDFRGGAAIMLLWTGLANYMKARGYRHLIGCAGAPLLDGGSNAATLRDELLGSFVNPECRVDPRIAFAHQCLRRTAACMIPPLIKDYLRLGARVCGEPAWDPDFNTANFLMWLSLDDLKPRHARHFDRVARQPLVL
jgi:putative hemolysin